MTLDQIIEAMRGLSTAELFKLHNVAGEMANEAWDEQIERDAKAGKLDKLAAEALAEYKARRVRDL